MSEQIITKQCSKCKEVKPLSEFYKRPNSPDGYRNSCKTCDIQRITNYQQTEKGKEVHRKAWLRYNTTEKRKIVEKCYSQTVKGKVARKRSDSNYKKRHPEKCEARETVKYAIRAGKLPRPDSLKCSCDEQAVDYHHHKGYAPKFWLDVVPICKKCHNLIHFNSYS